METPVSLIEAVKFFDNPTNAREYLASRRWPNGVTCPHCEAGNPMFLEARGVWKCRKCRKQFSVKTQTIFEDSPIALGKWLVALWLVTNCKNGVSSYEIARDLEITQKSTWFMLHRIREAMQSGSLTKLSGEVEADETFIGGKIKNMHKSKQAKLRADGRKRRGVVGKAIVSGLLERNTKEARVKVLPYTRQFHIRTNINENVEKGSMIYSDALKSYQNVSVDGFEHEFIDHTEAYVRGAVHTNGLENFWSLLKRSLKGTYVSVEPFHLQAYCDEQAFRFNNRKANDAERFSQVCSQIVNRRLTWNRLTGKDEQERQ